MTTTTPTAPRFHLPRRRHGARALVITALCAALAAGFLATVSHPKPAAPDRAGELRAGTCAPAAGPTC